MRSRRTVVSEACRIIEAGRKLKARSFLIDGEAKSEMPSSPQQTVQ